ncbi:uncharacterized protein NPIL_635051 [Nephila pilipes]|uniref:Uncharacterized protein n=1 Tax=Nephila pilipes TaxID=299642 RepID=A0A8X6QK29_NEPPI|nr:uncharacterized protein NPIL_635051 [Nephila pilipes]
MCVSVHRQLMKEYPPLCTTVEPYLLPLAEEDEDEDKILKFELDTVDGSSTIHSNLWGHSNKAIDIVYFGESFMVVLRLRKPQRTKKTSPVWYNDSMGGVDLSDQYMATYYGEEENEEVLSEDFPSLS